MRTIAKRVSVLCGLALAASVSLAYYICSKERAMSSASQNETESAQENAARAARLGLKHGWLAYDAEASERLVAWEPTAVKVIFVLPSARDDLQILVDIKRAGGKKDQRWEFPGGRVDPGEGPLAALLRELDEEDPSGVLRAALERSRQSSNSHEGLYYRNLTSKSKRHDTLFKAYLSPNDWTALSRSGQNVRRVSEEVYGFLTVSLGQLDTRRHELRKYWTPKSRRILKTLRQGLVEAST